MRTVTPPKVGEPITAEFLQAVAAGAYRGIAGSGKGGVQAYGNSITTGGPPGLRLFKAQTDFTEDPTGVWSGDVVETWLDRDADTYTIEHGANLKAWSHTAVSADALLWCTFNAQSGRWEQVSGSGGAGGTTANPDECNCGTCLSAGSITDCVAIGEAALNYTVPTPAEFVADFGAFLTFTHISGCRWESDTWEGLDLGNGAHDYTWVKVWTDTGIEGCEMTLEDET